MINGFVNKGKIWGLEVVGKHRPSPEKELESADKGPEIIVPLYLLERVQCQAAKNLQSWGK